MIGSDGFCAAVGIVDAGIWVETGVIVDMVILEPCQPDCRFHGSESDVGVPGFGS